MNRYFKNCLISLLSYLVFQPVYAFSLSSIGTNTVVEPANNFLIRQLNAPRKIYLSDRLSDSYSSVLKYKIIKDSLSKFAKFNKKAQKAFVYIPVPLYSYSSDAGQVFGLAKFNLFELYKNDTITKPAKLSGVFTISTKGRINFSLSTELPFKNNDLIVLAYINYKQTPAYFFGIGNDVKREDVEDISESRFKTVATVLKRVVNDLYIGGGIDLASYFDIQADSTSYLVKNNISGLKGGVNFGLGLAAAFDSRDNRYNAMKGSYVLFTSLFYSDKMGSAYDFSKFELDARKFYTPWLKHTIALQATTTWATKDVPFYELALMGGENQMRGYYKGALRDKVLFDAQVEYRMPIYSVFGITGWVGTGRVANDYKSLNLDGLWLSYGGGIRIKVDAKHNTNLRIDFGFGPGGINAFYINFAEAF